MKKFILFLSITLLSCGNDETTFENSDFNNVSFLRSLNTMTLSELGNLSRNEQIDAANNLSSTRIKEIWQEKIDLIILEEQDPMYVNELIILKNFINSFTFDRAFNQNELTYLDNLFEKSVNQYGKDLIFMTINFSSFEIYSSTRSMQGYRYLVGLEPISSTPSCNCGWSCDAAGGFECNDKASCNRTSFGCGWMFFQACEDLCTMKSI